MLEIASLCLAYVWVCVKDSTEICKHSWGSACCQLIGVSPWPLGSILCFLTAGSIHSQLKTPSNRPMVLVRWPFSTLLHRIPTLSTPYPLILNPTIHSLPTLTTYSSTHSTHTHTRTHACMHAHTHTHTHTLNSVHLLLLFLWAVILLLSLLSPNITRNLVRLKGTWPTVRTYVQKDSPQGTYVYT